MTVRWRWGLALFALTAVVGLFQIALALPRKGFGDEWRYLYYAENILNGHYSPRDRVFLGNGPAYPLLLTPFVAGKWQDGARLLNALLHAGVVLYTWLLISTKLPLRWALGVVAGLIVYPALRQHLPLLYTETLTLFLVIAWIFHGLHALASRRHLVISGVLLGLLCLTRVNYGPPTLCLAALTLAVWLARGDGIARSFCIQASIALVLCIPYLAYSYGLTGRPFYWSSAVGGQFYWLTSPFPEEYGDWYHQGWVYQNDLLREHHKAIYDRTTGLAENPNLPVREQVLNLSSPEAGDIFLEQGLRNVREHPFKFVANWVANLSRLFFDVPVSVRRTPFWNAYTKSHLWLIPSALLFLWWARRTRVSFPRRAWPVAAFTCIAFGAYSLVSSTARFLIPIAPVWVVLGALWAGDIVEASREPSRHDGAID